MKQRERWDHSVENPRAKQNAQPASETPACRVALLRQWRNKSTGKTCEQTTAEFCRSNRISQTTVNALLAGETSNKTNWIHVRPIKRVIQGNPIEWLTRKAVRNGNKAIQQKETIGAGWDHLLVILGFYHQGLGVKAIGKRLGLSYVSVWRVLLQAGVDTSTRRNYQKASVSGLGIPKIAYEKSMCNPHARIKKRVMGRIWYALKKNQHPIRGSFELVGCSAEFLKQHLERQFQPGMTFENYGKWHVDHIRPCASFDLQDPKQAAECFNWRNLQPLWAADNIRKSDSPCPHPNPNSSP